MPLSVWLGAACIAIAIPVLWWALTGDDRQVSTRAVENLGPSRAPSLRAQELSRPAAERLIAPVAYGVGRGVRRFTPVGWLTKISDRLAAAGLLGRWSPDQIVGAKVLLAIALAIVGILRYLGSPSTMAALVAIGLTALGFFLPDLILSSLGDRRKESIQLDLPDVLDQLTISVEAGLAFEAGISRIARDSDSPLAVEFGRMMQDIQLGVPRSDALEGLANRTNVDDLRHVVLALRQAEKLGVPLAKTLRVQALEMREKRRFRAEEAAYKLPVKMIFPLGLCILPALFIVIMGPAMIEIRNTFNF